MTTEEDRFHAALDANPHDHVCRLAFADWLDENAGAAPCPQCGGRGGHSNPNGGYREFSGPYPTWDKCHVCSGSGRVSDGRREMATGYRAIGGSGLAPLRGCELWHWFLASDYRDPVYGSPESNLPDEWFVATEGCRFPPTGPHWWCLEYPTRREAEDAAALAFGNLPAAVQAAILAGAPA